MKEQNLDKNHEEPQSVKPSTVCTKTQESGKNDVNHNNNNNNNQKKYTHKKPSEKDDSETKLKRKIGLLEAVGITIGSIIGSGIFISPKGIVAHVNSVGASLVIWAVCGLLSLIGAFCYAELGTTFPTAGGQYTYIFEAFGPVIAFLYLWTHNLIFVPIGNAVTGLVFAKYITQPFFPMGCGIPDTAVQLLAASTICLLTFLNCCDIRYINKLIDIFMFVKLAAVVMIIAGGGFALYDRGTDNFDDIWAGSNITAESLLFAIFAGGFAFGGWQAMSTMMEELKNPYKNLPRAIFISLILVTLIYILANISYFAVLSPAEMIVSDAVAVTFVNKLLGSYMGFIVPVFVSISTFGFLSIHIMTNSRNCFVGARHGHFPTFLSLITTAYNTPATSIMFQCILSVMFLYTADVFALINFGALIHGVFNTISISGLLYLRWKKPDLPRPFKIPIVIPAFYFLLTLLFIIIPIYVSPVNSAISCVLTLTGLPVYYLFINRQQSKWVTKMSECCTVAIQKLLMSVKED